MPLWQETQKVAVNPDGRSSDLELRVEGLENSWPKARQMPRRASPSSVETVKDEARPGRASGRRRAGARAANPWRHSRI